MVDNLEEKPILRWPLEIQHTDFEGQRCVVLRDPEGIAEDAAIVPIALLPIISRFDGEHSLQAILIEGAPYGLTDELLVALVAQLDELLLLETEGTRRRLREIKDEYRKLAVREAVLAGRSYPDDPEQLRLLLEEFVRESEAADALEDDLGNVVAVISPHIDYQRGWQTYARTYRVLEQGPSPDVIFVFGTAHRPGQSYFHMTEKDFATPLGVMPAAKEVIQTVSSMYGAERCFGDEDLHRQEHSIELQLPFIMNCYESKKIPSIVPILVGSFHEFVFAQKFPVSDPEVAGFVEALAAATQELIAAGKRVLFYGAVDLAHVGRHFGDEEQMTDEGLEELERRDREYMECACSGSDELLFENIADDQDQRRICGYPSMYTMLATMNRLRWQVQGKCLEYRQAADRETDCIVTFASAYWKLG